MSSAAIGKAMLNLVKGSPYRRNTRLPVAVPITIRGKDPFGRPLQETARTLDVGKQGIRVEALNPPPTNAEITVAYDKAGQAQSARVVWRGGVKRPNGRTEIGVEFLRPVDAEGMWRVKSPEDWRKGPLALTTTQKLEYFTARESKAPPGLPMQSPANDLELPPLPRPTKPKP